jgi:uncharacterized protein DUF6428
MKTREFIQALRRSGDKRLLFVNAEGDTIQSGYHLTEIKAVAYDTVDCGGQKNRWNETILQLWVPENPDDDYMKTSKFMHIYDKVRGLVAVDEDAEVRIEYGDEQFFPAAYHVGDLSEDRDAIRFVLDPPATTCKARDRARSRGAASCCAQK